VAAVTREVEQRFLRWPSGPTQEDVKNLEHEADRVVSELLSHANSMFVTPFDRDDIVTLAFAVDDVADVAESAAELLGLYGVERPTKQSFELCRLLVQAAEELAALLSELRTLRGSSDRIRAIKQLEDEADDVARAARASLFKDDRIDPVLVIRWKDIYEALEDAVDACDTAAHLVGNVLVKNA
jgi:predicted phosphate transport protein (TIGR00153 family)